MKKLGLSSTVLMFVTLGWGGISLGEQPPAPRGELRIVDRDPANWASITFNVMEHLMEHNQDGMLVPRLATDWRWVDNQTLEMNLRQGVRFHNGEVFDAEIVKLNWDESTRLRQPHAIGAYLNFTPGSRLEILDPYTIRFHFSAPDGGALIKISALHLANRQFYRDIGWGEKSW